MSDNPDLKFIVLDQNAISNLALSPDRDWAEILEVLRSGVKSGKLICPTPVETIIETIHLPSADRRHIESLSLELSNGIFIKFFWQLVAEELLATVRPNFRAFPFWEPKDIREISESETLSHREIARKEKVLMEADINSFERPGKMKGLTVREVQEMAVSDWFNMMRTYLNKFRNGQMIGDEQFVIQQILDTLQQFRVSDREIAALLEGIKERRWLQIPLLTCWLFLEGLLFHDFLQRGRRFEYNDEWDRFRAAAALHISHCFVTDRGVASMLKQLKFHNEEYFSVFSVAQHKELLKYLRSIC